MGQIEHSRRRLEELYLEWENILIAGVPDGDSEKERVRMAILWHEDSLMFS